MKSVVQLTLLALTSQVLGGAGRAEAMNAAGDMEITEESLLASMREAHGILRSGSIENPEIFGHLESVLREDEKLRNLQNTIEGKRTEVNRLLGHANAKQLQDLVWRLERTLAMEKDLRNFEQPEVEVAVVEPIPTVHINELKRQLEARTILRESEQELKLWVVEILKEELAAYRDDLKEAQNDDEDCVPALDIAQGVQVALTEFSQDGIGLVDHAQEGEIVHYMTSATYTPDPEPSSTVGNVWWSKFIPEDWEQLMPSGWEDWDVSIPSYMYHSLSVKGGTVAPPETILEKRTSPGSCWPMEGSSGRATFRLPYPVRIESFSVDHVPWTIIPTDAFQSAPKEIRVIGYPACDPEDDCAGLGFDPTEPMEIAQISYDVEGPSIQTFDSVWTQAAKLTASMKEEIDDDSESSDDESCAEAAACTAPPKFDVAGITVKVLGNWGNPDYTCMYRFRVHGEPSY